jgi:hypothetical protein
LAASNSAAMTFIAGAKILADRIGGKASLPRAEVSADASPLFHWCGVNPADRDLPKEASEEESYEPTAPGAVVANPA